jgi:colanic acid/amylovoran biosynthesis protein
MKTLLLRIVNSLESLVLVGISTVPLRRSSKIGHSVLLAAPGQGNIGDQAMFESYLSNTTGPVKVIVVNDESISIPAESLNRVERIRMEYLIYGHGRRFVQDALRVRKVFAGATSLAIIGADIMDGAYRELASTRRFDLARAAYRLGIPSRILGFSWNAKPAPRAIRAMLQSKGVELFARDPKSSERMRALGARNVSDSADLVFSLIPSPTEVITESQPGTVEEWCASETHAGRKLILINLNSLVEKHVKQVRPYESVVRTLLDGGYSVAVVPHDPRNSPSDVDLAQALKNRIGSAHFTVAPIGLSPTRIHRLAARASLVVSGRMHLAILSLLAGTPAISISYQGKVEGLYSLLGLSDLWISPSETFEVDLFAVIEHALENEQDIRGRLAGSLPRLRALSARNFENLPNAVAR